MGLLRFYPFPKIGPRRFTGQPGEALFVSDNHLKIC
jgi:hypothetical protein